MIVVWCPDWPVVAAVRSAGLSPQAPAVVVEANRVVSGSAPARAEGIRLGFRRREAQSRCPELAVFDHDEDRDARLFEPVVAAVEEFAPGVEVVRPGVVAVPARGPVTYFGGEHAVAEGLLDQVAQRTGLECQVGIADGLFTAVLAAHRGAVVAAGLSAEFLAPLSITELGRPGEHFARDGRGDRGDLVELLRRLGLRTLGAFAALPERDVSSRFGAAAVFAHRLAGGQVVGPLDRRRPAPELAVAKVLDPPAERLDTAAFAAKAVAQQLHDGLSLHGLVCTRLAIQVETAAGEQWERVWRCAEPLTAAGITDRLRWQLEGWLARSTDRPSDGVSVLRLVPEEVVESHTLQMGLWSDGTDAVENERAGRALIRVQGLIGLDGVVTSVESGGRAPADRIWLVPWGDDRTPPADPRLPWPGQLHRPFPTVLPGARGVARIWDEWGDEVGIVERHLLSAAPYRISVDGGAARPVAGWAGPWPVTERWWTTVGGRRGARLQVLLAETDPDAAVDGGDQVETALLLLRESGRWFVEGMYD
ncbi:MAG TPA: DNA polymerase Y family protein [Pseudonocardiaceae bacterium]|nr:DNA polymerase Y family protein [Pseudonocardiaceae bacterium]